MCTAGVQCKWKVAPRMSNASHSTCLDLAAAVRLDQDVFWLQVGVHQPQGVQERQGGEHLCRRGTREH